MLASCRVPAQGMAAAAASLRSTLCFFSFFFFWSFRFSYYDLPSVWIDFTLLLYTAGVTYTYHHMYNRDMLYVYYRYIRCDAAAVTG